MIRKFPLPKSEFAKNVLVMMTGTTVAQAIPVAVSPILTRLYTPEDFGVLALYMSLLLLLGSVVTLKYEQAIILPVEDEEAVGLVILCALIALITSATLLAVVLIAADDIASILGNTQIAPWLYLLPASMFAFGISTSLSYWFNRKKQFSIISRARVGQSTGTASAQLSLYFFISKFGIVAGAILGHLGTFLFLALAFRKNAKKVYAGMSCRDNLVAGLKKYKKFPTFQAPAVLLETGSAQLPVVVISILFGATAVGMYSLAQRVIRLPIAVISSSFGEVFRQAASEAYAKTGDARPIFTKSLRRLFLLSFIPFAVLFVSAPRAFSYVFGPEWQSAGEIARILTPMIWLSFIVSPLSAMIIIAEKQELELLFQLLLLMSSWAALWVGYIIFESLTGALTLFVIIYSLKYLLELYLSYKFCVKEDR